MPWPHLVLQGFADSALLAAVAAVLQHAPQGAGLAFSARMLAARTLMQQLSDVILSHKANFPPDFLRSTVEALSAAAEAAVNGEGEEQLAAANAAMAAAADSVAQAIVAAAMAAAQPPAPAALQPH